MAKAIRRRYPQTRVNVDSPCVVVRFRDYKFEIVPAVGYEGNTERYRIPAPGSQIWIDCYPHVPGKWLTTSNHYNNHKFIPLIKILKQWNRANKAKLKSFHLELLTGMVFNNVSEISSYPQGVYEWMYFVSHWIDTYDYPFVPEPGKTSIFVDQYLYENRAKLILLRKKLKAGLQRAERAYDAWLQGKESVAKKLYRQMFGTMFPMPVPIAFKRGLVGLDTISQPTKAVTNPFALPRPSLLPMALWNNPKNRLNCLLDTQVFDEPKQNVNALLTLLGQKNNKFPWGR